MLRFAIALFLFAGHPSPDLRLYVLDCGRATLEDGGAAADTGELDHRPIDLADPCFLIRHPRGWLLWDAGLAPDQAGEAGAHVEPGLDHVGNAALFPRATWILNRDELAWAEHEPAHVNMAPRLFAAYHDARTRLIDGDLDLFGDGRVRILRAPGHTPGSAVLWVGLRRPVILSGDLYISRVGRRRRDVPAVNADRAETLASMDRIERIAQLPAAAGLKCNPEFGSYSI